MPPTVEELELIGHFRQQAIACQRRAPLYAALSTIIADDPSLAALLLGAPPQQRLPVLLLAAGHKLLLDEPDHPLAAWYPNLTVPARDPHEPALATTFATFLKERRPQILDLLATRRTQTNEVGRCAMFVLAFGIVGDEVGPLAHLDIGASGGLNLLLDRYEYRFDPGGSVGGPSPVVIETGTRGDPPVPSSMPTIVARCGVDISPIDITDDGEAHWLEACVWPDQADRFQRLRAAIEIARESPPELLAGDAVRSVAPAVERMARAAHPVVSNSWVLNYLAPDERAAYLGEIDRIGAGLDLSWVFVEDPSMVPELPGPAVEPGTHPTVVTLVRYRGGRRRVEHLATCHPHGYWIHWGVAAPANEVSAR